MNGAAVFAVTPDYLFSVANVIIGFEKHSQNFCDNYIVFTSDKTKINEIELDALYKCAPGKRIFIFDFNELVPNIETTSKNFEIFTNRYTIMPLLKIFLPLMFDKVEFLDGKALDFLLWLDSDVLILGNISGILKHGYLCGCNGYPALESMKNPNLIKLIEATDVKPNGGVILYKKRYLELIKSRGIDYFDLASSVIGTLLTANELLVDEIAILAISKLTRIKECYLEIISNIYNFDPRFHMNYEPLIVHSAGHKAKFWSNIFVNRMYPEWEENNRIWLGFLLKSGINSTNIHQYNKSIFKDDSTIVILKEYENRKFWSFVLKQLQFSHEKIWVEPDIFKPSIRLNVKGSSIFYKLVRSGGKNISIELHAPKSDNINVMQEFENLSKTYSGTISSDGTLNISFVTDINGLSSSFDKFVEHTANLITSN